MDIASELRSYIGDRDSIAVAYSGGLDSTLLMRLMTDILGERCIGIFVDSPLLSQRQRDAAHNIAEDLDLNVVCVEVSADELRNVLVNDERRCYHCKSLIYGKVRAVASSFGISICADGENADDPEDERPGRVAASELGIISPFRDLGVGRSCIEDSVKGLGIGEMMIKDTCMATRIHVGIPLTIELLRSVEEYESIVRRITGVQQVRVRLFGTRATVLTSPQEIPKLMSHMDELIKELGSKGLTVIMDEKGYKG